MNRVKLEYRATVFGEQIRYRPFYKKTIMERITNILRGHIWRAQMMYRRHSKRSTHALIIAYIALILAAIALIKA